MLSFNDWSEFRESSDITVSGPGIDRLRTKVAEMAGRGAPVERNDFGFGHGDYTLYQRLRRRATCAPPASRFAWRA